jgi:3-hydroxyisobutyrate dehydrogenase-like beta-hydroxyacid dehydrogenase
MTISLSFIGLGVMGEPMCQNLHRKSGQPVTAYDINEEALERARSAGMNVAASIKDAAAADIVFTSLPGGPELAEVGEELLEHMAAGSTLVDTTTAPVALTRELAARFSDKGIDYADAPVARTRQAAREGTLAVMVGASDEVFARVEPYIACYANDISHCGGVGTGQVVKILNNMIVFETGNAIAEALAIGSRAGVDPGLLFETLTKGSADSFVLRSHGMKAILPGRFPLRAFSATYALKDISYAQLLAQETGVDAKGAKLVDDMLRAAIDKGYGDAYWPVLAAVVDDAMKPQMPEE